MAEEEGQKQKQKQKQKQEEVEHKDLGVHPPFLMMMFLKEQELVQKQQELEYRDDAWEKIRGGRGAGLLRGVRWGRGPSICG